MPSFITASLTVYLRMKSSQQKCSKKCQCPSHWNIPFILLKEHPLSSSESMVNLWILFSYVINPLYDAHLQSLWWRIIPSHKRDSTSSSESHWHLILLLVLRWTQFMWRANISWDTHAWGLPLCHTSQEEWSLKLQGTQVHSWMSLSPEFESCSLGRGWVFDQRRLARVRI